jgi:hypothetical protein
MAYDQTKLYMMEQSIAGPKVFQYVSADPIATVTGAGYITNGGSYGMKVGDWVRFNDSNLNKMFGLLVSAMSAAGVPTLVPAAGAAIGG